MGLGSLGFSQIGGIIQGAVGGVQAVSGLIMRHKARKEAHRREEAVRNLIAKTPDFRDSEAYAMGQRQLDYSKRFSDYGLEQEERSYMEDMAGRGFSAQVRNANNLRSGVLGGSFAGASLMDAYRRIGVADANMKLQKKQYFHNMLQNMQDLQTQAYNVDLGKHRALIELDSARGEQAALEAQTHTKSFWNGMQTMADSGATFAGGAGSQSPTQ